MKLVFATNNKNKLSEVQKMLPKNITLLSLEDIGCYEDIAETATTLKGNAKIKADYITNTKKYNCFADDTGLEVDSLNGEPGVYSSRYAGEQANNEDNIQKLLSELKDNKNRKAHFKTSICLNLNGKQFFFEGVCNGEILCKKQGKHGFGYDSVFKPNGYNSSFAEMSLNEKNKISHRGLAIKKLIDFLTEKNLK